MRLKTIYLKVDSPFSSVLGEWAEKQGIETVDYDLRSTEFVPDGLLLINQNQDIEREMDELHSDFDRKHLPTQKIDINGPLQVAVSNFEMWLSNFKCKNILVLGSENLVENKNLDRFLRRIQK